MIFFKLGSQFERISCFIQSKNENTRIESLNQKDLEHVESTSKGYLKINEFRNTKIYQFHKIRNFGLKIFLNINLKCKCLDVHYIIAQLNVRVDMLLRCGKHMNDHIIFLKGQIQAYRISFNPDTIYRSDLNERILEY